MFETSVSPTAPLNLDIEYQNADLWGLWGGGCERTQCTPPGYGPEHGSVRNLGVENLRVLDLGIQKLSTKILGCLPSPHST